MAFVIRRVHASHICCSSSVLSLSFPKFAYLTKPKNGVHFGREKKLDQKLIQELQEKRNENIKIKDLMKEYALSEDSVYCYLVATHELVNKSLSLGLFIISK